MPIYAYECPEHGEFEQLFKTLEAAEKKKDGCPCPDCDAPSKRLPVPSSFSTAGTQHSDMQKAVGTQARSVDVGGRMVPAYRDENGRLHEIKDSGDIKRWTRSNQLGPPRMVEWTNPITHVKSWVPQRQRMVAGPDGEVLETLDNPILRESEDLIDLGPGSDYVIPAASKTGAPIDPKTGVSPARNGNHVKIGLYDPVTQRPMTLGDCWGGGATEAGYGGAAGYVLGGRT